MGLFGVLLGRSYLTTPIDHYTNPHDPVLNVPELRSNTVQPKCMPNCSLFTGSVNYFTTFERYWFDAAGSFASIRAITSVLHCPI